MSDLPNAEQSSPSRIAWITGILCVACCAVPFIGIAIGSASLAAFAFYSEGAAIAIAAVGLALLAYKFISRRKAPACDIGCGCRPAPNGQGAPKDGLN